MPDDPQKLIETVREALDAIKAEWAILPKSATFRIEDITEWLIRFVDPNMKRIEESLESLSKLEAALGEKTVPRLMLEVYYAARCQADDILDAPSWTKKEEQEIVSKYMPGYTVK
jgi:isochorismate hydrolase